MKSFHLFNWVGRCKLMFLDSHTNQKYFHQSCLSFNQFFTAFVLNKSKPFTNFLEAKNLLCYKKFQNFWLRFFLCFGFIFVFSQSFYCLLTRQISFIMSKFLSLKIRLTIDVFLNTVSSVKSHCNNQIFCQFGQNQSLSGSDLANGFSFLF